MAPTAEAPGLNTRTLAIILVVAVAVIWIVLANMPHAPPQQVRVIKINTTAPPTQQPAQPQSVVSLFMCQGNAFRTSGGVTICGVDLVTDQYIFIKHGWIYAQNSTTFSLAGDVSTCKFSLSVNTLYVNCTSDIMVVR